jgi:hypothetical protein
LGGSLLGANSEAFRSAIIFVFKAYAFSDLTPLFLKGNSLTWLMVAVFLNF